MKVSSYDDNGKHEDSEFDIMKIYNSRGKFGAGLNSKMLDNCINFFIFKYKRKVLLRNLRFQ